MEHYLFGLATLPAIAVGVAALYYGGKVIAAATAKAFRRLPLDKPAKRAAFAAAAASSRRVHVLGFGGVSLVLTFGYNPKGVDFDGIYRAVLKVITPEPAGLSPRWAAMTDKEN